MSCEFCQACCQELAPLILRLSLAAVFLPQGFKKVFTYGYGQASENIIGMSTAVVPMWLANFMGYFLPFAELYIGLALLLGFGKYFTKILTVVVTFSIMMYWILKPTPEFAWFMNVHTWFFIAAITLKCLPFGKLSLDQLIWPGEKK